MSVQEVESFSQQSARKIFEKQKCLDGVSRMTLFPLGDIFLQSLRFYNMDISVAIFINPDTTHMPLYHPDTTHMPLYQPGHCYMKCFIHQLFSLYETIFKSTR